MKNTAGEAKRRGRTPLMSVSVFQESQVKDAIQKKETKVSPRLINFVLLCTIN